MEAQVITTANLFLKKEHHAAAVKHLTSAIEEMDELIADNDLSRDDEGIQELTQAANLMRKALATVAYYETATV